MVARFAGSHLRELERKGNIPYSSLKYHLHYLVRHGMIVEVTGNKSSRYYPKGVRLEEIEILGLLRQKNVRRILLYLVVYGEGGLGDLRDFTKLSSSTVSWYVDRLVRNKVLSRNRNGKNVNYNLRYDKDGLVRVLITYRESFLDGLVDKVVEMWDLG